MAMDRIPLNDANDDDDLELRFDQSDDMIEIRTTKTTKAYKINLLGGISIILGTVIGSGIFATPTIVITMSGSVGAALLIWVLCGVTSFCMALCFAELGTLIPKSGGEYIYLKEGLGDVVGFTYSLLTCLLLTPASQAISCLVAAEYIIKAMAGHMCDENAETYSMKMMAAFILGVITLVNMWSTKWTTYVQIFTTAAKLLAIVIVIITGVYTLSQGMTENFHNAFEGTTTSISKISYAINGGLWSYAGWNNLNYVTEEIKNPKRNLPLAVTISMILVTICYLLVNVAYVSALSYVEIESTNAVALTLANRWYGPMAWIIPFFVSCSIIGSINGGTLTRGWLVFSSAREKQVPPFLALVHRKNQTPTAALLTTLLLSWVMLFPKATNFAKLLNYFSFFGFSFYGLCCGVLLWLRYKQPKIKRVVKNPILVPIIAFLACAFQVVAPFRDNPLESTLCLLAMFIGVPIYYLVYKYKIPTFILKINGRFTRWVELVMNLHFDMDRDKAKHLT